MTPTYSSDSWTVEPFDAKLDLWTLGKGSDFIWVLLASDPEGSRHRSLPRAEGLSEIQARRGKHVLGGRVQAKPRRKSTKSSLRKRAPVQLLG